MPICFLESSDGKLKGQKTNQTLSRYNFCPWLHLAPRSSSIFETTITYTFLPYFGLPTAEMPEWYIYFTIHITIAVERITKRKSPPGHMNTTYFTYTSLYIFILYTASATSFTFSTPPCPPTRSPSFLSRYGDKTLDSYDNIVVVASSIYKINDA